VDIPEPSSWPPAGWYADPSGLYWWRWWDGSRWTQNVAPDAAMQFSGEATTQTAALLQAKQARLDGFMALAVLIWAAIGAVGLLVNWVSVDYYRATWHWLHAALHAIGKQQQAPPPPHRPLWNSLFSLVGLGDLVIEIYFLIWQHRAATLARALGYPYRHSPGWGVGCWFVPIVNLWMPYQAIRDCLPPGHHVRRQVLYAWLAFLMITIVLVPAILVTLVVAPGAVVFLIIVSLGAYAAVGLLARRVVIAVAADHSEAIAAVRT
jgi:hypothetical protein